MLPQRNHWLIEISWQHLLSFNAISPWVFEFAKVLDCHADSSRMYQQPGIPANCFLFFFSTGIYKTMVWQNFNRRLSPTCHVWQQCNYSISVSWSALNLQGSISHHGLEKVERNRLHTKSFRSSHVWTSSRDFSWQLQLPQKLLPL